MLKYARSRHQVTQGQQLHQVKRYSVSNSTETNVKDFAENSGGTHE
jgi:hypothetical protein